MPEPKIASHIANRLDHIVESWVSSVRSDPRIKSDAQLSALALENHIPVMIRDICELINTGSTPDHKAANEARIHAFTRLKQGFRARDIVRELSLLRVLLLDQLKEVSRVHPFVLTEDIFDANRIINLYIDEDIRYAVAIYTEQMGPGEVPSG